MNTRKRPCDVIEGLSRSNFILLLYRDTLRSPRPRARYPDWNRVETTAQALANSLRWRDSAWYLVLVVILSSLTFPDCAVSLFVEKGSGLRPHSLAWVIFDVHKIIILPSNRVDNVMRRMGSAPTRTCVSFFSWNSAAYVSFVGRR